MNLESKDGKELRETLENLKEKGCIGVKMSTEDSGLSLNFIDFVNNRVLDGVVPLNMKIGGPDAQNDIIEALRIGVSGIIAPMVESPFGIHKFVTAMRKYAGEEAMRHLLVSVNLESVTAYRQIDDILRAPEIEAIDQIVIGSSDLARSVAKPKDDPTFVAMVTEMAQKAKKTGKIVRIGGMMSLLRNNQAILKQLLEETNANKVNTSNICFSVKRTQDLHAAYVMAQHFEKKLFKFWSTRNTIRLVYLQEKISSLESNIKQITR
jgi:hypothetical protein